MIFAALEATICAISIALVFMSAGGVGLVALPVALSAAAAAHIATVEWQRSKAR